MHREQIELLANWANHGDSETRSFLFFRVSESQMKVVNLKDEKNAVKEVLEKAIAHNFQFVMLFGIKDGEYRVMSTSMNDRLRVIGFLEPAKTEVWQGDIND